MLRRVSRLARMLCGTYKYKCTVKWRSDEFAEIRPKKVPQSAGWGCGVGGAIAIWAMPEYWCVNSFGSSCTTKVKVNVNLYNFWSKKSLIWNTVDAFTIISFTKFVNILPTSHLPISENINLNSGIQSQLCLVNFALFVNKTKNPISMKAWCSFMSSSSDYSVSICALDKCFTNVELWVNFVLFP